MALANGDLVEQTAQYAFIAIEDGTGLLFDWKHVQGLGIADFQRGIAAFAAQCRARRPAHPVIDASRLDQGSPAVAWLRGQTDGSDEEPYAAWWMREIVPVYHTAGIASLAVATGDPNAPGELENLPPGVKFKVGYFPDLEAAMRWQPA